MSEFRQARCVQWQDEQFGVQFNQIGHYEDFIPLLDDFKRTFYEREWHPDGWWLLPQGRYRNFQAFCSRHGLRIRLESARQLMLVKSAKNPNWKG
jgi:hypothetical protein